MRIRRRVKEQTNKSEEIKGKSSDSWLGSYPDGLADQGTDGPGTKH